MNKEELRKLLKENRVHFYSYWGKTKLEDLAKINKLIPEPEPEPKPEPETEPEPKPETEAEPKPTVSKRPNRERMRKIRNAPISVKFIDIETKEEKIFPSIYKASQFLDKCPQTVALYGRNKAIWDKKYQIIIE